MNNFIESEEFVKHLNNWLFKSEQKDSNWIFSNRSKIPNFFRKNSNYLYKGLFGVSELFNFKTGFVRLNGILSFSEDENVAKKFLTDSSYKFRNGTGVKILVKKRFSTIVFDINKYYLFYGDDRLFKMGFDEMNIDSMKKEKEIIVKDAKIYSKDFTILL